MMGINSIDELMELELIEVCTALVNTMSRKRVTSHEITISFNDVVFKISAESETVPESFEDFIKMELGL